MKPKKKVVKGDPLRRVSRAALAAMTGRDLQAVYALFAAGRPDAPEMDSRMRIEEAAGKAFVEKHLDAKAGGTDSPLLKLRVRRLELEVGELEQRSKQRSAKMIPLAAAYGDLETILSASRLELEHILISELPAKYVGKSEEECRALNYDAIRRYVSAFHSQTLQLEVPMLQQGLEYAAACMSCDAKRLKILHQRTRPLVDLLRDAMAEAEKEKQLRPEKAD